MSDGYLYIRKAEQLIDSIKASEVTYAKLLQVLGVGLIKEKKSKEAIEKLQFAEAIFEKTGEKIQLIVLRSFIGEAYTLDSNFKSAINEFSKGFTESEEFGIKQFMVQFSGSLSEVYQKIGNKDSAYKYLQLYTHLKDELKVANTKDQLTRTELTKKFEERERILNETYSSKQKNYDLIIAFVLLLCVLLALSIFYYRRKYRVANLSELKLKLHAERLELEQEKLNSQLVNKENKLVELEQRLAKNAMLEDLVDELQIVQSSAQKTVSKSGSSSENSKLIQQGKIWEEFEIRFAKTHAGFYDRLMQACPGLTTNERRLCAFLKLDMTTKEISTITGQSIRAIEIARTRLRKKLNLSQTETSLFEFLSSL
jgi:DNA-binding CsgD family transcriptional regulator